MKAPSRILFVISVRMSMKGIWLKSPCVSSGAGEIVSSSHGQVQLNGAQLNPVQQQTQMSHQQMPTPNMAVSNNTRLLAHTLENRKRVLQTLIREKADTLV